MAEFENFEDELQALFQRERTHRLPNGLLASSYRAAMSGEGALGAEWQDKPHRLVYDLLRVVDTYREQIKNQDGDFAVRLGQFRKKLEEADLHGHYNIFQECFGADIDGTFSTFPKPQEANIILAAPNLPEVVEPEKPKSNRRYIYAFLNLPFHTQLEIIHKCGYTEPVNYDDGSVKYFTEAIAAIRESGKLDEFKRRVDAAHDLRKAEGWE